MRATWLSLVLYLKPPLLNSLYQMVITGFYTNWSKLFFLDTTRKKLRWPQVGGDRQNSKNGWVTNNVGGGAEWVEVVNKWGVWPLCVLSGHASLFNCCLGNEHTCFCKPGEYFLNFFNYLSLLLKILVPNIS